MTSSETPTTKQSKRKIISLFTQKIQKLTETEKKKFLTYLLANIKVDFSTTKRTTQKIAGLTQYQDPETCFRYSNARKTKNQTMYGEKYLWKPAGTEAEFQEIINSPKMPWTPRNTSRNDIHAEKKALLDLFRLIFRTQREGLFVSIRNNKITHWIPFFKLRFQNDALDNLDFSEIPKHRKPNYKKDWLIESCNVVSDYYRTEQGMAEYYDLFTQACRKGIENCDLFVNMKGTPIIKDPHRAIQNYGILVLSQNTRNGFSDLSIPSPNEWAQVSNKIFPFNCQRSNNEYTTSWSKKKSGAVYRGSLSGCYATYKKPGFKWIRRISKTHDKPYWFNTTTKRTTWYKPSVLEVKDEFPPSPSGQMARVELVQFLKQFRGANVSAALQGNAKDKPKLRIYGNKKVKMWPVKLGEGDKLNEVEYDILTWSRYNTILKRSGTVKEQEEIMEKIATGRSGWWPAGVVNSNGRGIGDLAGGPAYKKAVKTYRNLILNKSLYEKEVKKYKKDQKDQKTSRSPSCSSKTKSALCSLKKTIEKMEKELEKEIAAGEKERNWIHGKGQTIYPRRYAKPVGGMLKREGLKGLQKFWKQNGVGTPEERERIMNLAKIKGVMSEKPLSLKQESEYKFVIVYNDIPGIRDFYKKAQMGSVLLIFEDIEKNRHWLLDYLKPMVHYIPVTTSNFEKTYKWCLYNEDKPVIKTISHNIKDFVKQNFTKDNAIQDFINIAELGNILNISE